MEKVCLAEIVAILVLSFWFQVQGKIDGVNEEQCSIYTFNKDRVYNSWENARKQCSGIHHGDLVSMETNEEWEYLKYIVTNPNQSFTNDRWYVGLKNWSQKWCWISDSRACANETTSRIWPEWRWAYGEPNNIETEHCVEMLRDGTYYSLQCNRPLGYTGYICERKVDCSNASGDYIFKIQQTTVQPFTTEKKHSSKPETQQTLTQETTAQPYTPAQYHDECSGYYFHDDARNQSWNQANALCNAQQAVLASIESNEEWEYLKNIALRKYHRWYIGLKYFPSSKQWCWLSRLDTCLNETSSISGTWRWDTHEPNNLHKDHCVEMFFNGNFNNIECNNRFYDRGERYGGYICEKKVDCSNASRDYIFKIQQTTVQPFTTEKKHSSKPETQQTLTKETTTQPYTPAKYFDCVDNRNDCHGAKQNGLCDELDYPPEHQDKHIVDFITTWCRKTCNVNNCNGGAGEIKPTKAPFAGELKHCADNQELASKCKGWGISGFCKPEYGDSHYLREYMYEYCSATCARIVGEVTVGCKF